MHGVWSSLQRGDPQTWADFHTLVHAALTDGSIADQDALLELLQAFSDQCCSRCTDGASCQDAARAMGCCL